MSITTSLRWSFLIAGIYALACAPAILIAERFRWPEWPMHMSQFGAVIVCFSASVLFLWNTRGMGYSWYRWLAAVATVLCGLWLAIFIYVVLTLDFSGID
jgi:H+/Cl- antiporter ClcA